jgi:hypothetical protein
MAMRIGEGTTRVKALIDMYLLCASASISAMENVTFWLNQYNSSNKADPNDPNFLQWLTEEIQRSNNSVLLEMQKSYIMHISYLEKAIEARERILTDYAELLGTGILKDILSPDVSSEDFFLDEYQIALLRAKALVLYWERKTAITEAVIAYAEELSSGRMTEAEGLRAWEEAKNEYNKSMAEYEAEINRLMEIGEDFQAVQESLSNLIKKLQAEEDKLSKLYDDYTALVSVSIINRAIFFHLDLNNKYKILNEDYKTFLRTGSDSIYFKMLETGLAWGINEHLELAQIILDVFINGDENDIISLSQLMDSDSEIDIKIRLALIDLFSDNADGILPLNSPYSGADWYAKVKGLDLTDEERDFLFGNNLSKKLYEDYQNSVRILLEKRLEFELEALLNFLNEEPETDEYEFATSEHCLVDNESAARIYEILLKLKERIELGESYYTDDDDENDIILGFIMGFSYFTGSEKYFTKYNDDVYFCLNLMELFNEYGSYSSFLHKEIWQQSCQLLTELFKKYNIEITNAFLPDPKIISEAILNKSGDFVHGVIYYRF